MLVIHFLSLVFYQSTWALKATVPECTLFNKCRFFKQYSMYHCTSLYLCHKEEFPSNRCGETFEPPYTCACDEHCQFFGDCCQDFRWGRASGVSGIWWLHHCLRYICNSIWHIFRQACRKEQFQPFLQNNYKMFECVGTKASHWNHVTSICDCRHETMYNVGVQLRFIFLLTRWDVFDGKALTTRNWRLCHRKVWFKFKTY